MRREIKVGSVSVPMEVNAATPLTYRKLFQRDLWKDIMELSSIGNEEDTSIVFSYNQQEIIENVAYVFSCMASRDDLPKSKEDWLTQFELMDILMATEDIISLFNGDCETVVEPKKDEEQ